MCSRNIEDISTPAFLKQDLIDPNKMKLFMEKFINESKNLTNNRSIDKIHNKLKREFRINPSKNQMRVYFYNNFNVEIGYTLKRYFIKRPMRSDSGVLVVTVVLTPEKFSCNFDCYYCPQETDLKGNHTQPRSYISSEPAMLRALRSNFDLRQQIWDRISAYINQGNIQLGDIPKMVLTFSGGTWESYPIEERDRFVNESYYAFNTFGLEEDRKMLSLEEEQKINETAKYRVVEFIIETRPDMINKTSLRKYRNYGVTRLQLGAQTFDDSILEKLNRGCTTKDLIKAIRLCKQVGLKIVLHLMPDLPGSSPELDLWVFKKAIIDPDLQFDDVKIYPTAICKSDSEDLIVYSKIGEWYKDGLYKPYAEENIEDLIRVIKYYFLNVKPWVRVERCIRDIPGKSMIAGYQKKSNLRQIIDEDMEKKKEKTYEIRSMEIMRKDNKRYIDFPSRLVVRKYDASEGIEYHISMEAYDDSLVDMLKYYIFLVYSMIIFLVYGKRIYWGGSKNYCALFGFLRLRIDPNPGGDIIPEINNTALIREVHVYGNSLGVGSNAKSSQHKGYGKKMMNAAENIALQHNFKKMSVIAGIGSREYYKNKCGYYLSGTYMVKDIGIPSNFFRYSIMFVFLSLFCYKLK